MQRHNTKVSNPNFENSSSNFALDNKKNGLEYNEFYKEEDAFETFSNYIKNENYYQACRALFSGMKIHEQNLTILQYFSI